MHQTKLRLSEKHITSDTLAVALAVVLQNATIANCLHYAMMEKRSQAQVESLAARLCR